MIIINGVAWHVELIIPVLLIMFFIFINSERPRQSSNHRGLGIGWSSWNENSHVEWYENHNTGQKYWKVYFDE